jgi:hypothetical protein
MIHITQENLINFLYKLETPEEQSQINVLLLSDANLNESFQNLKTAKNRLDKIQLISPDHRTINNILNYAKQGIELCS